MGPSVDQSPHARAPQLAYPTPPQVQNDIKLVYKKIEEGADVNFVFGRAYKCPEGYTALMVACHRSRWARFNIDATGNLRHLRTGAGPGRGGACCGGASGAMLYWQHAAMTLCTAPRPLASRPAQPLPTLRLECAKALLRAGADPNYTNGAGDQTIFWAIDGGGWCCMRLGG